MASDAVKVARIQAQAMREARLYAALTRPEVLGTLAVVGTLVLTRHLRDAGVLTAEEAGIAAGAGVAIAVGHAAGGLGTAGTLAAGGAGLAAAGAVGQEWPTLVGLAGGAGVGTLVGGFPFGTAVGALVGGVAGALTD